MRNMTCKCENCGRSNEIVELEQVKIRGHVADLCLTCAHVLSQSSNQDRYFSMVRKKSQDHSNAEMKKVHTLLSSLLLVGAFMLCSVGVFGISKEFDFLQNETVEAQHNEYVSFHLLNQYK